MTLDKKKLKWVRGKLQAEFGFDSRLSYNLLRQMYEIFCNAPTISKIPLRQEFFSSENAHKEFIRKYRRHLDADDQYFNEEVTDFLKQHFKEADIISNAPSLEEQEDEDEVEITNFATVQKILEQTRKEAKTAPWKQQFIDILEQYDPYGYIAKRNVQFDDIITLNNKDNNYKIYPNPFIMSKKFGSSEEIVNNTSSLLKTTIFIKRHISSDNMFATKYVYRCPKCQKELEVLPYRLTGQLYHSNCYPAADGSMKSTAIEKAKYRVRNRLNLHIYEAKANISDKESFYIYTKESNLHSGLYDVELFVEDVLPEHNKKHRLIAYALNIQEHTVARNDENFIVEGAGRAIADKLLLPNMKLFDIWQGIIDMYEKYIGEKISHEGFFMQLSVLMSGLMKLLNNYNKMGVSVVGTKSMAKTFPATRFAMVLDRNYYFSQNAADMSGPGLKGGIGDVMINGTKVRIFIHGVVTFAGLCVFDEASKFFTDRVLNDHLKSLPQYVIHIDKIGGGTVEQNYTPILISNISEHADEYINLIKESYYQLKKASDATLRRSVVAKELSNKNFFLPLFFYKDDIELRSCVAFARRELAQKHIDWKNMGRIEASNRLLMEVIVTDAGDNVEYAQPDNTLLNPPDLHNLPVQQFQKELIEKYGNGVDFLRRMQNKPEKIIQMKNIEQAIIEWFKGDGNDVYRYLCLGEKRIDPKLNSLVFSLITWLEMLEHPHSNRLSTNVKDLMRVYLLKCKRGLSKAEYDFDLNITKIENVQTNVDEVGAQINEGKDERAIDMAKQEILKEKSKHEVADEYMQERGGEEKKKIDDFFDDMQGRTTPN